VKAFVLILCGGADVPSDALDGLTPLSSASMESTQRLARSGRVGLVRTVPSGAVVSAGASALTILGRDPSEALIGDGPLIAMGSGVELDQRDWVFVLDLVSVEQPEGAGPELVGDGRVGDLPDGEGRTLIEGLCEHWRAEAPELMEGIEAVHLGAGRALMIDRSGRDPSSVETIDPGELHGLAWGASEPKGAGDSARALRTLIELGRDYLETNEINAARAEQGLGRADLSWMWGQGRLDPVRSVRETHGIGGAMVSDSALGSGVARALGLDPVRVEHGEATESAHLAAMGARGVESIRANALTCVHVSAPMRRSMCGDIPGKIRALGLIDRHIVGAAIGALERCGEPWRALIVADRVHDSAARRSVESGVPFAMGGTDVVRVVERNLTEADAAASDLRVEHGHELLEFVLRSGLSGARG
jgi:2,3-bisphosphoglycerate-independent phosphoglycerate mutase